MSLNVAFVGEELGYFADEGIQVEEQDAGNMAEAAFLSNGQTDVVFTGATEILTGIAAGVDMRILYEYWYEAAEGVYVSEDSPIQSVTELKGKTIGLASDSDLAFLKVALDNVGLQESDVETIVVGDQGGVIADALKNNTIAALAGSTGEERSLAGAGVPLRDITPKEVKDTPGETFVAMANTVEQKPDLLQRFFRAWAKASYASTIDADVLLKMGDRNIPEATMDRVQAMIGVEQAHKTDPTNGVY
jgi:NitT/TauT family transport system substrate-binding protein